MMKWLRAHTKQIMVFTVLMAMFSFVGGSALVEILAPQPDKDPVIRAFGQEHIVRQLREAQNCIEVLKTVGINWQYDGEGKLTPEHWYVLAEEAKRKGLQVSEAEIDQEWANLQQMFTSQGVNLIDYLRARNISIPLARQALRLHETIMKNAGALGAAAVPSEPQVRHRVRDTEDKVRVQLVALDAEKWLDPNLPLSPEAVTARFEKYKDVDRETSADGVGYKLPRRAKLEYVAASLAKIEPQIQVSFEEVKAHWKANKSKYTKVIYETPPVDPAASQPTVGPTTQPAPTPVAKTVEKTITEARPDIERDLRKAAAKRVLDQVMSKIAAALQRPWQEEKVDPETGYKPIPEAVKSAEYFKSTVEKLSREAGVTLTLGTTGLLSEKELDDHEDLRGAVLVGEGAEGLKLSELAFRVPPFYKREKDSDTAACLQLFQSPDTPLTASSINIQIRGFTPPKDRLVLFRVIEADESRAPTSLDEVREQVERDLRLEAAMKAIEPAARELYAAARKIGLKAAWELYGDLKAKNGGGDVLSPPPFARLADRADLDMRKAVLKGTDLLGPPEVMGVGASHHFVEACLEMADDGWVSSEATLPDTPQTKLVTTRPSAEPPPVVRLVEDSRVHKWVIVERVGVERVDSAKYDAELRDRAFSRLASERGAYLIAQWFKPANIEQRTGFKRILSEPVSTKTREGLKEPPKQHPMLDFQ